jgi:hypothetical protein
VTAHAMLDTSNAATSPVLNPWRPMTDPVDVAHLGKLGEELNECGSAASRCLIQGIDQAEPVTGKVNRQWLQDEIADVLATVRMAVARFDLDIGAIEARAMLKTFHLQAWHKMIEEGGSQ